MVASIKIKGLVLLCRGEMNAMNMVALASIVCSDLLQGGVGGTKAGIRQFHMQKGLIADTPILRLYRSSRNLYCTPIHAPHIQYSRAVSTMYCFVYRREGAKRSTCGKCTSC